MREKIFYNALNKALESNYKRLKKLREKAGSWEKAFETLEEREKSGIEPEEEWNKLEGEGIKLVLEEDESYPSLLREIPFPPLGIYYRGNLPSEGERLIAIIGTRKATVEGQKLGIALGESLARAGVGVISGLALGIDAGGHDGALRGKGKTYAVLANGLSSVYPRQNEQLARKILEEGGGLLSEYPMECPPYPNRFIERNRIVSGLAEGVVIIEAPERSGTLATARFAIEQNREVFVVPGPVAHPNYVGSLKLLREGARLISNPEDLLEDLGIEKVEVKEEDLKLTSKQKKIIEVVKEQIEPVSVDRIEEITKISTQELNEELAEMTINEIIKEEGGRYYI